jgi:hypothetical protein
MRASSAASCAGLNDAPASAGGALPLPLSFFAGWGAPARASAGVGTGTLRSKYMAQRACRRRAPKFAPSSRSVPLSPGSRSPSAHAA